MAAFAVPNYKRFTIGQTISLVGSWTETVAQAILVLRLTHSGVWLGLATAARYAPVLLLTPYAGVIVDRYNKRRILLLTQSALAAVSLVLGLLVVAGEIRLWIVFAVALAFGVATALDNPARLAFVPEMVGRRLTRNAVTLNSTLMNVGRGVGPIVAAALVATVGVGWCFVAHAASFAAVICSLLMLDAAQLHQSAPVREVSLPLFACGPLHGGGDTYSLLIAAFGFGSVAGGLYCIHRPQTGVPRMIRAAVLYAAAMLGTALTSQTYLAIVLLIVVGVASIIFLTTGNSAIQIAARPDMRGRVIALWSTALVGSTPIGATIIGAVGDSAPRFALILGAGACAAAAALAASILRRSARATESGDRDRSIALSRAGRVEG